MPRINLPEDVVPVGVVELRDELRTWLERVAYGGDELVILRGGKPMAALVSIDALLALRRLIAPHEDALDTAAASAARKAGRYRSLSDRRFPK